MKIVILFTLILFVSCSLFQNEEDEIPPKNVREMEWEIMDTVNTEGSNMERVRAIWGSSPNDLYIVGELHRGMYHYDGNEWNKVIIENIDGMNGPLADGHFELADVSGFGSNVIAVGTERIISPDSGSLILYKNGTEWERFNPRPGGMLNNVFAYDSKNIWVGGSFSTLYKYNGSDWSSYTLPFPDNFINGFYTLPSDIAGNNSNNIYLKIYDSVGHDYLMHYNGSNWTLIDSLPGYYDNGEMWVSPSGIVYSVGLFQISKWDGSWETIFRNDNYEYWFQGIVGTDDNNITVLGYYRAYSAFQPTLFHYNGDDWAELQILDEEVSMLTKDIWTDGQEIWIIGMPSDSQNKSTMIVRGK
ncbi:MAG: hypothetical protein HOB40_06815 [Candidatus Marinimicrobia bacterium]|jgi:hypothetical protein|nr:hypothetical protein [Candidatus Neomarinimicrobiota bacterium]MBT3839654.1 hypothetical protein [Candidatus Neomarinimicrobiota bacterium]MBT4282202.1 hypothetical protein [Candidatus Neomarinimicrobiota bacterium]MBT4580127.1 hypothetical protein [Candidatus Neomarinimicrobiota bacterium]MBT5461676.1 hypothetical protein [Candidatus Neomarinimicrobiota bacterium]